MHENEKNAGIKMKRKVFFGWWTVLASGIMNMWGYGVWHYGFGVFFQPLSEEFGWTRAQISTANALGRFEGGVEGPFGGVLADKYGPRTVNLVGMFIAGLGFCLMSLINSFFSFLLVFGLVVSMGFNLALMDPLDKAIANWFVKKRGMAISIARVIVGVGSGWMASLITILFFRYGWRSTFLIVGLITWGVGLPLTWLYVKPHRPEFYGMLPDGVNTDEIEDSASLVSSGQELVARETGEVEFSARQAMRTRTFWIYVLSGYLESLVGTFVSVHQIPHLVDRGFDPVLAASALGFMVFMSVPGRVIGGILVDRCPISRMKYLLIMSRVLQVVGLPFLMKATNLPTIYVFDALYGVGYGINLGVSVPIRSRFFGRKAFGTIGGTIGTFTLPIRIFSPIYAGWVYDVTGSYVAAFTQALVLYSVSTVVLYFLTPPRQKPEVVSDVRKFI